MAKSVRWQIPFVSIQGIHYRVDIYDEVGGWSGVTKLTPGDTPFVTDENASDDFFCPIRTHTGTLQIVTKLPNGGMITLDELLPANNIARPVFLLNLDNSNAVEWQGFLSCEAYNQDYIGIPQTLSLPLISVLEAMDSVQLDQSRSHGLTTIKSAVKQALNEIVVQVGMQFYTHVNYSGTSYRIFNKYIDQTVLFEQKEYNNENSTTYIVSGLSVKEALSRIATFMGWVVREQGKKIYFERMGDDVYTWEDTYYQFGGSNPSVQQVNFVTKSLASDMAWMGTGHQRSIAAGAKSVEVVAKLERSDFALRIPDFPFGDTSELKEYHGIKYKSNTAKYFYIQLNYNNDAYNNNAYGYFKGNLYIQETTTSYTYTVEYLGEATKTEFLNRLSLYNLNTYISNNPQVAGAILIRYAIEDTSTNQHDLKSGLYCPLMPGETDKDAPIFKMWTPKMHTFFNGVFKIQANMLFNALYRYNGVNQQIMSDNIDDNYVSCTDETMRFVLRVGNKYWDGSDWVNTRSMFPAPMKGNGMDFEIPVNEHLSGQVQLEILAGVTLGQNVNILYEVIFNSLEVGFQYNPDYQASSRSSNHYYRVLATNFRDEISIGTELASMLNNEPSPSLIMENNTTPMSELTYTISGGDTETRRPEVDLLNRLAAYYGAARQRLELEVAHPTSAPLPLLRLNGINDGKVYLPLSESRDWQTGVCKLTCFESPT